ncbi:cellulose binding domain-containing protein, partial [Streptomyces sp. CC77]|uniref:cellulose binding domain-containing protein n=1 Tax=Streptomyces sp. CC77 TaxID=1906739 RepID=UPI001587286B
MGIRSGAVTGGHRRRSSRRAKAVGALVAAAVAGGAAFAFTGTAQAAAVSAQYTRTSAWSGGYTGQYVIANATGETRTGWTLEFDLPAGTRITSLWNGEHTVDGRHVTVKPASWNKNLAPGASVTVGFVTAAAEGGAGDPAGCLIDGAKCSADPGTTPRPSGRPTDRPTPAPSTTSASPRP